MTLINVVRIAKVIALLAFVLPWVAVSCSIPGQGSVDLATASGIELIQGKMSANPDAQRQMTGGMGSLFGPNTVNQDSVPGDGSPTMDDIPELGLNIFGVAAVVVIVVGLLLSFAGKGKSASRNVMITSLLGLVLVFGTVWWWKDQMKKQDGMGGEPTAAEAPFSGPGSMNSMGAQALDNMLQERWGYWIVVVALVVAAGAGLAGMVDTGAAKKPDGEPPPA